MRRNFNGVLINYLLLPSHSNSILEIGPVFDLVLLRVVGWIDACVGEFEARLSFNLTFEVVKTFLQLLKVWHLTVGVSRNLLHKFLSVHLLSLDII